MCYQTLPFLLDYKYGLQRRSAVLVVSPLISLMIDQVQKLRAKSVKSSIVTSSRNVELDLLASDSSLRTDSIFYCALEALVVPRWRASFEDPALSGRIVAVVIDEAHCVSKW